MTQADELKRILQSARTIAVVGLSTNPEKDSYGIAQYLKDQGYRIIPVHPSAGEILGEKVYPSLTAVPDRVDVVDVFRPSEEAPGIVEQAIEIGAKAVWMQVGIVNEEAAEKAAAAGIDVVMDACMRVAHRMLIGPRKV